MIMTIHGNENSGFFRDRQRKEKLYKKIDALQRHRHEAESIEFDEWCDVRTEEIKQEAKRRRDKNETMR
jgi:hypothetical protein